MLTVKAAAAHLRVSDSSVVNFCRRGLLPKAFPWLHKPLLFREEDVEALAREYLATPAWRPHGAHRWPEKRAAGGSD